MFPIKLIKDETNIDFIKARYIAFALSFVLILFTGYEMMERGLNLGIDFAGGILLEVRTPAPADLSEIRPLFDKATYGEVSLQKFGDSREVLIRLEILKDGEQAQLVENVKTMLGDALPGIEFRKIDYVGPTVGKELIESGVMALIIAMGAMMLYIWFRFEWQFGLGGILALIHDAILVLGFYAITGFDFGLTSIAALLTVVGYSINDSVVIYDRIRENMRKYKKMPMPELLNKSINDTLSRTIITGLTTMMAALALALFGGEVIKGFSYALLFGVFIGTYSSIYISAPVLLYFSIRREQKEEERASA